MKRALIILVFLLAPVFSFAQSKKIPVAVYHGNDDQIGRSIAFALKEAIRASQSFMLVDYEIAVTARIVVRLVSVEERGRSNLASALAVALVYDSPEMPLHGVILNLAAQSCPRPLVESCAKSILPFIDGGVESLRKNRPDLWNTL